MYNICLFLCLLTLPARSQERFTVLTHNVLAFSGHPKETHEIDTTILRKAISYYKGKNVDMLVLQECPSEKYIKILADSLDFNFTFFRGKYSGSNTYPYGFPGCIMSKYEIVDTFDLNTTKVEVQDAVFQRHLGSVVLKTPMGLIQLIGLHLCANWGGEFREGTRLRELDVLLKAVPKCDSCVAHIVAGDFNSKPGSNPYLKMNDFGFVDTHQGIGAPTVPVPSSENRIDYIFMNKASKLRYSTEAIRVPYYPDLELYLSDHQPCMTIFVQE